MLRLMLAVGFLADMEREDEMEVEGAIFEQDLPLTARTECMGFFVDRLEVNTRRTATVDDDDQLDRDLSIVYDLVPHLPL